MKFKFAFGYPSPIQNFAQLSKAKRSTKQSNKTPYHRSCRNSNNKEVKPCEMAYHSTYA